MSYLTNIAITPDQLTAFDNGLTQIEAAVVWALALSPEQRKSLKRMGEKSESFCRQALNIAGQNPQIVPPNVPVAKAAANLATLDEIRPRALRLARLVERLADTDTALGNDIMKVSLNTYRQLKLCGQAEGLEPMRRDLGGLFAKASRPAARPSAG
jgi:hypothetical protein